jgi:hypothetical protein
MADSCEHGNEPSGSIKVGKCLNYLSILSASQEGLYSMTFVAILSVPVSPGPRE